MSKRSAKILENEGVKIQESQSLYAGHVLRNVPADAVVARVKINGREVDAEETRKTFASAIEREKSSPCGALSCPEDDNSWGGWLDRKVTSRINKAAPLADWGRGKIDRCVPGGASFTRFISGEVGEAVVVPTRVEIQLTSGTTMEFSRPILDRSRTTIVKHLSRTTNAFSMIPLLGNFVVAGGAVAAALLSVAAGCTGQFALGKACGMLAAKLGVLAVLAWLPGSSATSAIACLADSKALEKLQRGPTIAEITGATINPPSDCEVPRGTAQHA